MSKITAKTVPLNKFADYSVARVSAGALNADTFIGVDNLLQNKLGKTCAEHVPTAGNVTKYNKGDTLIGNIRPYLKKIWYANNSGGSSADVLTIHPKEEVDPRYIYYNLFQDHFFDFVMAAPKGTRMPRGDKNRILDYPIPNFKIEEQQKIVSVLSALDDKIELNNKINGELEKVAKTLYDHWFVQFDFPDVNGNPYKTSGGAMTYNEELKRKIPKDWEVKKLHEILNKFSDTSTKIPSEDILMTGKFPVISQDFDSLISGYTNEVNPITNTPLIVFGDHSCTLKYVDFHFFRGADGTQLLTFDKNLVYYVYLFLKSIIRKIPQYGKYERHFKYLKDLYIIIPPKGTLESFRSFLQPSLDLASEIRVENQELAQLRDWLLPMLMNGQVTVK